MSMYWNLKRLGCGSVSVMACDGRFYCDHSVVSDGYVDLGCWKRISKKDYDDLCSLAKRQDSFLTIEVKGKYRHSKSLML